MNFSSTLPPFFLVITRAVVDAKIVVCLHLFGSFLEEACQLTTEVT